MTVQNAVPVQDRRKGIGGTDIAAILGLSPFSSPYDVFLDKFGLGPDISGKAAVQWGKHLEPVILNQYAEATKTAVQPNSTTWQSTEKPWALFTPDGFTADGQKIIEIKTANAYYAGEWGAAGTDQIPEHYLMQVQWYMGWCKIELADVAVLIGGNDFRIFPIPFSREIFDIAMEEAEEFWTKHILGDTPPPASYGKKGKIKDAVLRKFPRNTLALRDATPQEIWLCHEAERFAKAEKESKEAKERIQGGLKEVIGNHEGLRWGNSRVTWKTTKDSESVDYERIAKTLFKRMCDIATSMKPGDSFVMPKDFTELERDPMNIMFKPSSRTFNRYIKEQDIALAQAPTELNQ